MSKHVIQGSPDEKRQELLQRLRLQHGVTGHELVALQLKACGLTHVYGVSGMPIDATLAACGRHGLRVITTRHQQAAVLSAAAHNYFAGQLKAAVMVSSGPAVTNCATGILVARDNHWPVVILGGRVSISAQGTGAFQDFDGAGFFQSLCKGTALVTSVETIAPTIATSCELSTRGPPGPYYIDITVDALQGQSPLQIPWQPASTATQATPVASVDMREVVQALNDARNPVLLIGDDLRWGGPWQALETLVKHYRMPFVTSPNAHGFLPDQHEFCGTNDRAWLLSQADLVLLLGASLDWVFRHGAEIPTEALMIRLGHGTDPVLQKRPLKLVFDGQPAALLQRLIIQLPTEAHRPSKAKINEVIFRTRSLDFQRRLRMTTDDQTLPLTPACWLYEVAKALPGDTITVLDGNIVMAWAQLMLPVRLPVSRLTASANGCMGTGLPFAMAAAAARPEVSVVAVCGDFALGLNVMELETAIRHELPILILLGNNHGNGGRLRQSAFWPPDYPERVCQLSEGVRYDLMMEAIGGTGVLIEALSEIGPAISRALTTKRPTLIQIDTRDDVSLPKI